jgi:hypothetical protein
MGHKREQMEPKYCPIMSMMMGGSGGASPCLRQECAWWDGINERCIIKTIASELVNIRSDLVKKISPGYPDSIL